MFSLVSDDRIWAFSTGVLAVDAGYEEMHCANSIAQF